MWKKWCLLVCLLLSGCGASIEDYKAATPKIDIFSYFAGESRAWGMVQDYSGKQVRRFEVAIRGEVLGNTLTLHEDFVYDDGERQTRVWRILRQPGGSYSGTAGDIIGVASGNAAGNAFNWRYQMDVKTDSSTYRLSFDDWIYQQDQRRLLNVTSLKKWGVEVARVTIFFDKPQD